MWPSLAFTTHSKGMVTQYFQAAQRFPMASETFLNEQESAAMPGMSSLLTMLGASPGTCIQAFHTAMDM